MSKIRCSNSQCVTRDEDGEVVAFVTMVTVNEDCEVLDELLERISRAFFDFSCWKCQSLAEVVPEKDESFCPSSEDGKHKPYGVSGPVQSYEELVVDITCIHCGTSGSTTIKEEDVLW